MKVSGITQFIEELTRIREKHGEVVVVHGMAMYGIGCPVAVVNVVDAKDNSGNLVKIVDILEQEDPEYVEVI